MTKHLPKFYMLSQTSACHQVKQFLSLLQKIVIEVSWSRYEKFAFMFFAKCLSMYFDHLSNDDSIMRWNCKLHAIYWNDRNKSLSSVHM